MILLIKNRLRINLFCTVKVTVMKQAFLLCATFFLFFPARAQQFEADPQIRPRYEFRNGFKTLLPEDANPASLISQRSRLILGYDDDALQGKFSLQSIGVWAKP